MRETLPASPDIIRATEGTRCDRCKSEIDVAAIYGVQGDSPAPMGGFLIVALLCSRCLARAIQEVTGFRASRTLESWYAARDNARNIRLTRKGESAAAE